MGRIHILADQVASQIAAGEVVDRPASVVKELLENSLDAGASKIVVEVEGGGRKLIRITDDGWGMMRDDALLAFERHATSKLRTSDDLLAIDTLGFRGEALPSIASVARIHLQTRMAEEATGTQIEIAGGKILRCEEAGLPAGTTIAVRDLFFNTPARRKFLKSEVTELSHVTALLTHYALAHPEKHFELHSATHALLIAPPVSRPSERIFQIFGKDTLDQLLPIAAEIDLERTGLPEPPPWKRDAEYQSPAPGLLRIGGFVSKPELQKLNRNSIYCFVNRRLVRDRVIMHAVSEAYHNIIPSTSFPVVLLFLEIAPQEIDVNVHPAKTEIRFRQPSFVHNFVRDSIRNKLIAARPAAGFLQALSTHATATSAFVPDISPLPGETASVFPAESTDGADFRSVESFRLTPPAIAAAAGDLPFTVGSVLPTADNGSGCEGMQVASLDYRADLRGDLPVNPPPENMESMMDSTESRGASLRGLSSLRPLGQLKDSFILAVNEEGLWIIDQHVAHERILFERVLRERKVEQIQRQRLLMPLLLDLLPAQMVTFARVARALEENGFEVEPFGPRTIAVKAAPVGLEGRELERMLSEVLEQSEREEQAENLEAARTRIAASIACHAAIKINTPLDSARIEWLLVELAKTEHPTSCPHGRPIALRYAWKDIQRAFQRI